MYILSRQKTIWFWVALLTSASMVASIPAIILFAIYERFLLMGISIILLAHGFYGCVFYWLAFAKRCSLIRILKLVTSENMITAHMLSMQSGKSEEELASILKECIIKGYLSGYYFDDEKMTLFKIVPVTMAIECPSCGASVATTDGIGKCEYCGTKITI